MRISCLSCKDLEHARVVIKTWMEARGFCKQVGTLGFDLLTVNGFRTLGKFRIHNTKVVHDSTVRISYELVLLS